MTTVCSRLRSARSSRPDRRSSCRSSWPSAQRRRGTKNRELAKRVVSEDDAVRYRGHFPTGQSALKVLYPVATEREKPFPPDRQNQRLDSILNPLTIHHSARLGKLDRLVNRSDDGAIHAIARSEWWNLYVGDQRVVRSLALFADCVEVFVRREASSIVMKYRTTRTQPEAV